MAPPAVDASVSNPSGSAVRKIAIEVKIAHRHRDQHWPGNMIPRTCKDEDSETCDTTTLQPGEQGFTVQDKGIQNGQRWIVGQFWRNNVSFLGSTSQQHEFCLAKLIERCAEKIERAREIQAQMRPARDLAWCNASPNQLQAYIKHLWDELRVQRAELELLGGQRLRFWHIFDDGVFKPRSIVLSNVTLDPILVNLLTNNYLPDIMDFVNYSPKVRPGTQ
ncbi:hypothetical protein V8F33_005793 [Rhypophila sp. PSN 637]